MDKPLRVLIVDDSEDDAALLIRELRRGGYDPTYQRVDTAEAMNAALDRQTWDIAFGDYSMPQFNGVVALKIIRERRLDLPFIFVSGTIDENVAVAAMRNGANDYIMKGNLKRLLPAVERELREAEVRRQHKQAEEMIQHMAYYDTLTGLPNRNMIYDRLLNAIRTDSGQGKPMALLLMDLDRFKEINDTLGHHRGDLLLKEVGARLQSVLFKPDMVARLGGDEFAILLPRLASSKDINGVIQKILRALRDPFVIDDFPVAVEASIGIALHPEHGTNPDILLQHADVAMYAAKESGRGYAIYAPELDQHSPEKLALLVELRKAIDHNELVLYYQPKISLSTKRVIGLEALVRWKHPSRGMIPPNQFILPAEQTGLIGPLTLWVIEAAVRQCREYQKAGFAIAITVNLSARNLMDARLSEQIAEILRRYDLPSEWLQFEITESAIMADPTLAIEVIKHLNGIGFHFDIDDFGTGHSSLVYLKQLPIDRIKIDLSFVKGMTTDNNSLMIVKSTIDLAHNLGIQAVAEGVENEETFNRLVALGCDSAQGYYMCKPLPSDELTRWLKESPYGLPQAS